MQMIRTSVIFILYFSCLKIVTSEERLHNEGSLNQEPPNPTEKTKSEISIEKGHFSKEKLTKEKEKPGLNRPHIIIFLADDLGWNDVSYHGSPQIPTPNIDALAASSIILHNYYTRPNDASSRASLMTGKYPINTGLQHYVIKSGERTSLPLRMKIMPQYLKKLGYSTNMIGKWHLGFFKKDYTPTFRGFDRFFGFYNEQIDYYDYTSYQKFDDPKLQPFYGIDLQDGITPIKNFRGQYATDVFTEKAINFIEKHNESSPFFLYMSHLAPHVGNDYLQLQAPPDLVSKNSHIKDPSRKIYAGVVSALDNSLGQIIEVLDKRGFLDNSIIIFASDNGGGQGKSSNWPLRGRGSSSFEGAIRVPSFIWSPHLKLKEPWTSNQLMDVTDWLPTIYSAIGGNVSDLGKIDGYDMWKALNNNLPSPRNEILHNLDIVTGEAAFRRGDLKLVNGMNSDGNYKWYSAEMREDMNIESSMDEWVWKNGSIIKEILEKRGYWLLKEPDTWRKSSVVICKPPPKVNARCEPHKAPCLFNVTADPCEYNNLSLRYPKTVKSMMNILKTYNSTSVVPLINIVDPRGDPRCHGFAYVPWLDEEYNSNCPNS